MSKLTLIEIVQDIANDLETDNVNSINDTVESAQIAQVIKTTYFEMIANRNWPHLWRTMQMASSGTASRPTHMLLPERTKEVGMISYNMRKSGATKDDYKEMYWMDPEEFIRRTNKRDSSQTDVDTVTEVGGIKLLIKNDKAPEYYTSFDDEYIVADSYDSDVESSLQSTKTQVYLCLSPTWTHADTFTPDLPVEAFPALVEEAKSTAFVVIKQQANEKAEQKASRQHRWLARKAWRAHGGVRYPNYGRVVHGRDTRRSPHFNRDYTV